MPLAPSNRIDEPFLAELVRDGCPESETLEFKVAPPGLSDNDKREFMKDVCALANAGGGDLIYGIDENNGAASQLAPITTEVPDALQRRLSQLLDTIDPRISGVEFVHVPVTGGYVTVLRIPGSFDGPHSIRNGAWRRYPVRSGTMTSDFSMDQLRAAFGRTAALKEQADQFFTRRIALGEGGNPWRLLVSAPLAGVYLVPLAGLSGRCVVDIKSLFDNYSRFLFSIHRWGNGMSRTMNLDGLVVHPGDTSNAISGYRLAHRNGALEAVQMIGDEVDGKVVINPTMATTTYLNIVSKFISIAVELGMAGPAMLKCALFNALGADFSGGSQWRYEKYEGDRNLMVLPDVWIEDVAAVGTVDQLMQPTMDILWQAFGYERCQLYDASGEFRLNQ